MREWTVSTESTGILLMGGSSEIGSAIAQRLSGTRPARMVPAGRSGPRLQRHVRELAAQGHSSIVAFSAFDPLQSGETRPTGHRLLRSMSCSSSRCLSSDQRDFFYATER
ncbi:hypothetical protein [Kineosporia mesophila]|nr:hypothetical protein [Kineosporia mesophila]MCD5353657.1 hypothetical protein [Kineosporia mesophila]